MKEMERERKKRKTEGRMEKEGKETKIGTREEEKRTRDKKGRK